MMAEKLIEAKNLSMYFNVGTTFGHKQYLRAVDDVSLIIHKGETLGLVGESGCGKSTLGRSLIHMYTPTSGEVYYKGEVITQEFMKHHAFKMQMIFQDPLSALNPRMTVADIIAEPLIVRKFCKDGDERMKKVYQLMETVGLRKDYAMRYPHEFSGGQCQRIGIARTLAADPEFIVCDEPVSALDVSVKAQIINMFGDIQKSTGISYLFITHDLLTAKYLSHRIAVMYLGKIVEVAGAHELYENPLHPYTKMLLSAISLPNPEANRLRKRIMPEGEIPSPMNVPSGCPFRTRCKYADERCANEVPGLSPSGGNDHMLACFFKGDE